MFTPPRPVSMTLNLAPMVDVMMCLIIFFLLASKIATAERQPIELPFAQAADPFDNESHRARVVINVRPIDPLDPREVEYVSVAWDGNAIVEQSLRADQIADLLKSHASEARDSGQELSCVIRADRSIFYGDVEVVMRGAAGAGISKLVFSTNAEVESDSPS
ncbi:MAG: ExbD/TolR family protein [Phycisphaerae bacterium]